MCRSIRETSRQSAPSGIEHTEIGDQMLFVVPRERWVGRREIADIGIEGLALHETRCATPNM
jgi:hypothetical protein